MKISVVTVMHTASAHTDVTEFECRDYTLWSNGTLIVNRNDGRAIAVYPPGGWTKLLVIEDKQLA